MENELENNVTEELEQQITEIVGEERIYMTHVDAEVNPPQVTEIMEQEYTSIPEVEAEVNQRRITGKKIKEASSSATQLKININMVKREKGEAYTDYKNRRVPEKSSAVGTQLCTEKCRLKCNNSFADADRNSLFKQYYSLPTTDEKNVYLFGCLKPFDVKQPSSTNAVRQKSFRYFVTLDGKSKQVCKSAFLKLFNVGRKKLERIRNQISQGQAIPAKDKRGRHMTRKNQTPNEQLDIVRQHIKSFPAEMLHYSRNKNEHRLYLSPMLSINKMYELFKNQCFEQNLQCVKNNRYRQIFVSEFNFGFGSPKSDTCKVCDSNRNKDEQVRRYKAAFEEHIDRDLGLSKKLSGKLKIFIQ
ncbi:uncharacterized protein LOC126740859 [Anthonomus grandis grandis]|uniref:uncharacterized protein LOC126740859 n=1 Tax=Anthonomus grandis grandis TaxID=2921223 RepID=UPI002165DD6A|nr:uncharacterized protein LOC126740859 [Anthonomus grandis grandis]XP_050302986.1 uncharacterized protein LOC126740859 [Anthonomus grandis grandis]